LVFAGILICDCALASAAAISLVCSLRSISVSFE
jgi:hypothetical protein